MRTIQTITLGIFFYLAAGVYADNYPYSQLPPGNLQPSQCPMFVCFGFDDNAYVEGVQWAADLFRSRKNPGGTNNAATFDATPARATFFITAGYGTDEFVVSAGGQTREQVIAAWKTLYQDGHEIGNHSWDHPHGAALGLDGWKKQISDANSFLVSSLGISAGVLRGFRTPFLEYDSNTLSAVKASGLFYDCSIEFGFNGWTPIKPPDTGWWNGMSDPKTHRKLFWPHTLDNGSPPGNSARGDPRIPGLWEVPVYTYLKPDNSGVVTGFDFNLWTQMDKDQFAATLKYNFDLRRSGNRNPLSINVHTDYYTQYNSDANSAFPRATWQQRRQGIQEFLDYALQFPETRVVTYYNMLSWIKNPVPIAGTVDVKKISNSSLTKYGVTISGRNITVSEKFETASLFSMIDLHGRVVFTRFLGPAGIKTTFSLPASLPHGMYIVYVKHGQQAVLRETAIVR